MQYSFANNFLFAHIRAYAIRPYSFWQKNGEMHTGKAYQSTRKAAHPIHETLVNM